MSTSVGGRGGGVLGRVRRASLWCLHEWRSARFGQLPVRANASLILFAPSCHVARCAFSSKRVCVCARGRSCTGRPLFFLCRRECVPHLVGFASDGRKKTREARATAPLSLLRPRRNPIRARVHGSPPSEPRTRPLGRYFFSFLALVVSPCFLGAIRPFN